MRHTILFVDDEESLLDIVGSVLEGEGFAVVTARTVEEAIEKLAAQPVDLILSDITMPGKNGFDFFHHVRSLPHLQHVPFLFLSAHSDAESIVAGKEIGSDDYLTKPVDFHLLLSSIRGKLRRKEQIAEASLQQSEKIKSEIFRLITHEMRTPLTSILGATEMLSDSSGGYTEKELTEFLQMLQNSSRRLNMMVDDYLTVTKIESGEIRREMDVREQRVTPQPLVQRIIDEFAFACRHHQVTIDNRIVDATISVHIYGPHLESILRRLIDNAVKFSHPGGRVLVDLYEKEGYVFTVQDFGIGIPEGKKDQIFRRFGQIDREHHEQQGSGLGLYIAHHLAGLNGAELWYDSAENAGSTFALRVLRGH